MRKKHADTTPPDLIRAVPAFAKLGIGRTKAYAILNAGMVPAVKLDRATFIRRADWDSYIANLPPYCTPTAPLSEVA